jgi:hypothetical protein
MTSLTDRMTGASRILRVLMLISLINLDQTSPHMFL